jgi:hypothetical protein
VCFCRGAYPNNETADGCHKKPDHTGCTGVWRYLLRGIYMQHL